MYQIKACLQLERGINLHQSQRLLHLHECQIQCYRALYLQYNNKRCWKVRNVNHCRDAISLLYSPFNLQNLPLYVILMVQTSLKNETALVLFKKS